MFLELIRIIEQKKYIRGPHPGQEGGGRAHPYWARPMSPGTLGGPPVSIFCYMKAFTLEKIMGKLTGRNSAATTRNQSRAPTQLFCRGHFPPGGGNHHQRHHQRSSHREGVNIHQHLHQHHLLSNPSSSLVSNLVSKTTNWYLWVASSVDYSL